MAFITNEQIDSAGKAADKAMNERDALVQGRPSQQCTADPGWLAAEAKYKELYDKYLRLKNEAHGDYGGGLGGELPVPKF